MSQSTKTGSPVSEIARVHLSPTAADEIRALLGLDVTEIDDLDLSSYPNVDEEVDEGKEVLTEIESWLDFYLATTEAAKIQPREADYKHALSRLNMDFTQLKGTLDNLHSWIRMDLESQGASLSALNEVIENSSNAANKILGSLKGEHRGRPRKNQRLISLVSVLRSIFAAHYRSGSSVRPETGSKQALSPREAEEADFVKIALGEAGIPHPNNIRRLFSTDEVSNTPTENRTIQPKTTKNNATARRQVIEDVVEKRSEAAKGNKKN